MTNHFESSREGLAGPEGPPLATTPGNPPSTTQTNQAADNPTKQQQAWQQVVGRMKSQSRSPRPNPPITARQEGKASNRAHAMADLFALERGKGDDAQTLERGRRGRRKRANAGVSGTTHLLMAMEEKPRPQNLPDPSHFTPSAGWIYSNQKNPNNSTLNLINTKQNARLVLDYTPDVYD